MFLGDFSTDDCHGVFIFQVIWVEHVEVDDRSVHNIYRPLVNSGLAFGAKRWVATLDRQCERLASAMASNIPAGDVGGNGYFFSSLHDILSPVSLN